MRIKLFKEWLPLQKLTLKTIKYNQLLNYIGHLQNQEKSKTSINTTLRAIEHYYHFLKIDNIALNVRLRGVTQEQIILLSEEELQEIYSNYQDKTKQGYFKYSNKISAQKKLSLHKDLSDRLPETTKWPQQANCAECDAVNQALHNGAKWEDIQIHTIHIRSNGTLSDVIQCNECQDIFKGMHVTSQ